MSRNSPSSYTFRLSTHFLLSDFLGCHSVYARGLANRFTFDEVAIREGEHLCNTLLEPLLEEFGPVSIFYGYISPSLSKAIVKYQDPSKPSYHRWDKGAAADVIFHRQVVRTAPIFLAHRIDEEFPEYSRMITYAESAGICLATDSRESTPRRAFYENRYIGPGVKPLYVRKSSVAAARAKERDSLVLEHDWRGAGYPTYHCGGKRQLQDIRVGDVNVLTDFLYDGYKVEQGLPNTYGLRERRPLFRKAAEFYGRLLITLKTPRVSIVRGYSAGSANEFGWHRRFALQLAPPTYVGLDEIADAASEMRDLVGDVKIGRVSGTVLVEGVYGQ